MSTDNKTLQQLLAEYNALIGESPKQRWHQAAVETGGPAFPMQEPQAIHAFAATAIDGITDPDERDRAYLKARREAVGGATLRDYFAAKALQGFLAQCGSWADEDFSGFAAGAYRMADAMLAARKENEK